jgi:adenylate cyclase class 2
MNPKDSEIEVKFFVTQLDVLQGRLQALDAQLIQPRTMELNLRFDTPEHELERGFRVLRLRMDTAARMTYKGPAFGQQGVRVRQEIEFEVSDFDSARSLLQALGYRVVMIYEKYRTVYRLDGVDIALDELPYGRFVELEGPDAETIHAVSDRLSLDWEASAPSSYAMLFEGLRTRMGLPFRDLTFNNFTKIDVDAVQLGVRPADVRYF